MVALVRVRKEIFLLCVVAGLLRFMVVARDFAQQTTLAGEFNRVNYHTLIVRDPQD